MRILKNVLLFQSKILPISLVISFLIGGFTPIPTKLTAISLCIIAPCNHFYFYNLLNKNQYFYYFNLGINSTKLWQSTGIISLSSFFIFLCS